MIWWSIYLAAIALVMLIVWWRQGPRRAIVAGILLALLVPEWVRYYPNGAPPEGQFNTASVWVNLRVAIGVVGACMYLLHPKATYNVKLIWTDWAVIAIMATHLISDLMADGFAWGNLLRILLRIYGEWFLPYIMGRIAIQSIGDVRWALPLAVGVTIILATISVTESVLKMNPNLSELMLIDMSSGTPSATLRPIDGTPREADRIGFKRAYGPTMHPIYFAALQLLLLPWMIYAASRAFRSQSTPAWWAAMPLVCALGVAGPVARGPFLAIAVVVYVMALLLLPQKRRMLGIAGAVAAVLGIVFSGTLLERFEKVSGTGERNIWTMVNGQWVRYTGERHRFILFEVYAPAIAKTGLFGWGTDRLSQFPARVPRATDTMPVADLTTESAPQQPLTIDIHGKPVRPQLAQKKNLLHPVAQEADVATLDNAFLLFTLRFGWVGLLCFTAITGTAVWNFVRLANVPNAEGGVWLAAMAGTMAAMICVLLTVWMPQDFGFFYLFLVGASAGLLVEKENPKLPASEPKQKSRRRRRRRRSHGEHASSEGGFTSSPPAANEPPLEVSKEANS